MRLILILLAASPLFGQPRVLLTDADIARISKLSADHAWANQVRNEIVATAGAFPQTYLQKYGLSAMELPAEGGQWSLWYVCPVHGVSLRFAVPNTHTCSVDNRNWTGWPYDQVIYMRRHDDLAAAARDNALAFRLTGRREFGEQAASILLRYADRYLSYPLKDKDNRNSRSGARVGAQTLDEAIWLIPIAWAYDLLSGSDVLTAAQRSHVERDLLRAAVATIQRNDAGVSNWQSWHNAGVGAVAFALNDEGLIRDVIDGKSGLRFQLKSSVLGEGFWYEGAWGYHFYALDALAQLAEMAARNGIDVHSEPNLRNLFLAPLKLVFADGNLPAFNDSGSPSIFSYARLYEIAYARYGDPSLAAVASRQTRGRNALLWGVAEVPREELGTLTSEVFADSGYAVLRAPSNDHAAILKFGPHGGGHGHYDKLGIISFALGGVLGVDPGTQSYAAPTHETWDKVTVAHNTVVVDERTQAEATGKLLWNEFTDRYSAASADAGPAYRNARLSRTMFLTNEYALDLYRVEATDGQEHAIDWIYHNAGPTTASLPVTPFNEFPRNNGYQHLTKNLGAVTNEAWKVDFDGSRNAGGNYGAIFRSNTSTVQGAFEYSHENAASGRLAGRISYQFTGAGYLLATTPALANLPVAAPSGLSVMIHGDGSGHALALRINDATDERFVLAVGPVNWTGWKKIEVGDFAQGSHYLGNADGIIDTPVRNIGFELTRAAQGKQAGTLYVDDIRLQFADAPEVVAADFELAYRSLRVWMLSEPATTVVTGEGLGPDLLRPMPYVMARRKRHSTEFVTLLEPYQESANILRFERQSDGALRIEAGGFVDVVMLGLQGVTSYIRQ